MSVGRPRKVAQIVTTEPPKVTEDQYRTALASGDESTLKAYFLQQQETLPPAGDARREVLTERKDTLEEAAETLSVDKERMTLPKIENEIAQHFDDLEVPGALPEKRYCWTQADYRYYGRFINMKRKDGWEVVTRSMPEAELMTQMIDVNGNIRCGDVILMRIPRERYEYLESQAEDRRRRQQGAITGELEAMAHEAQRRGANVQVHTDTSTMNPRLAQAVLRRGGSVTIEVAKRLAMDKFDEQLRAGTVGQR